MAISVDWKTFIITVPKADTVLVDPGPPEIREYDVYEQLWKELKGLEDDEVGMPFPDTQSHETASTLGGVTYAHKVSILAPYTVTFEAGAYQINLIGCNHNVLDRANIAANPALRSSNSAGLIMVEGGGGGGEADWTVTERGQIRHRLGIDGAALAPTATPSLATAAAVSTVQADTDDIQGRLPSSLSSGRMRAAVEAIGSGLITATEAPALANLDATVSSRATPGAEMDLVSDAVDAAALKADAVTEIQAGLATSVAVAAVQGVVEDVESRLPASLTGGRIRAHVEAMDSGVITAAQAPALANLDTAVSSRAGPQIAVRGGFAYDPSSHLLDGNLWLERDGQHVVSVTSAAAEFYSADGALLFSLSDLAPDAGGAFRVSRSDPGFDAGSMIRVRLQIVAPSGTYTTLKPLPTVG